tara:strand:+ start:1051 stop:1254 length:204 start_codon:yes stop_codon:yes gene_type:complete
MYMNMNNTEFSPFETSQFNTCSVVFALVAHAKLVAPAAPEYSMSPEETEESLCNWALMQYFGSEAQA